MSLSRAVSVNHTSVFAPYLPASKQLLHINFYPLRKRTVGYRRFFSFYKFQQILKNVIKISTLIEFLNKKVVFLLYCTINYVIF